MYISASELGQEWIKQCLALYLVPHNPAGTVWLIALDTFTSSTMCLCLQFLTVDISKEDKIQEAFPGDIKEAIIDKMTSKSNFVYRSDLQLYDSHQCSLRLGLQ